MEMAQMQTYSFDALLDDTFGKVGTPKRDSMEKAVDEELRAFRVGEAIRQARKERSLTQQQLGEMIGVQKAQISRFENGHNITLNSVSRIFKALGLQSTLNVQSIGQVVLS